MKHYGLAGVLAVVAVVLGFQLATARADATSRSAQIEVLQLSTSALQEKLADLQAKTGTFEAISWARLAWSRKLVVRVGHPTRLGVKLVQSVPGYLFGTWHSSGQGYGDSDDSISTFRVTDPTDRPLASLTRATEGSIVVRIESAGAYLFEFQCDGLGESAQRDVELNLQYVPDDAGPVTPGPVATEAPRSLPRR